MKSSLSGRAALTITAKTEAFLFFPKYTPGPLVAFGGEIAADITKLAADRKTGNRHKDSSRIFVYAMP